MHEVEAAAPEAAAVFFCQLDCLRVIPRSSSSATAVVIDYTSGAGLDIFIGKLLTKASEEIRHRDVGGHLRGHGIQSSEWSP